MQPQQSGFLQEESGGTSDLIFHCEMKLSPVNTSGRKSIFFMAKLLVSASGAKLFSWDRSKDDEEDLNMIENLSGEVAVLPHLLIRLLLNIQSSQEM